MKARIDRLRDTLVQIGLPPELAKTMDPAKPMLEQGMDSVDFPAFCLAFEETYKISLDNEIVMTLHTLNDFAKFVGSL